MQILDTPTSPPPSKPIWGTVLRYGLFCGLTLIVGAQLLYHLGIYSVNLEGLVTNALTILLIGSIMSYLAIKRQRDYLDGGFISSGKAILVSSGAILLGFWIQTIWNYLFINFIDPEYLERFKAQAVASWQNQVLPEDLDILLATLDSMKDYPSILLNSFSLEAPIGLLSGVVVSLFMVRRA
jgi:hypothetical protein